MAFSTTQQKLSLMMDGPGYLPGYAESMYGQLGLYTGAYVLNTHLASGITDRLAASPTGDYTSMFSTYTPTVSGTSVYNTNLWGGGGTTIPGWKGIIWYNSGLTLGNGTAITKRHIITPEHGTHNDGDTMRWILADGTFVDRTVLAHTGGGSPTVTFRVLLLDSDLPDTIPIALLFDGTSAAYTDLNDQPAVAFDGENKARVASIHAVTSNPMYFSAPADATSLQYWEATVSGDSGSPCFVVWGTQLVYISGLTTLPAPTDAYGPNALLLIDDIATAVAALNTAYSVSNRTPEYLSLDVEIVSTGGYVPKQNKLSIGISI